MLEHTEKADGASNLLMNAKDKYLIVPCHEKLFVVIQLSEDIMMEKFTLGNYEKYSSTVKDFQVFGSLNYPTSEWRHLGDFTALSAQGDQQFGLRSSVRYLKFKFLTHHGAEHFCTLSQIKVHGTTAVAAAHNDLQVAAVELKEIETLFSEGEEEDLKQIMQELGDDDEDEEEEEEEQKKEEEEAAAAAAAAAAVEVPHGTATAEGASSELAASPETVRSQPPQPVAEPPQTVHQEQQQEPPVVEANTAARNTDAVNATVGNAVAEEGQQQVAMAVGNEPSASGQLAENALPVHQLVLDGSVTGAPDARVAGNKHNNGQEAIAMAAESPIAATLAEIAVDAPASIGDSAAGGVESLTANAGREVGSEARFPASKFSLDAADEASHSIAATATTAEAPGISVEAVLEQGPERNEAGSEGTGAMTTVTSSDSPATDEGSDVAMPASHSHLSSSSSTSEEQRHECEQEDAVQPLSDLASEAGEEPAAASDMKDGAKASPRKNDVVPLPRGNVLMGQSSVPQSADDVVGKAALLNAAPSSDSAAAAAGTTSPSGSERKNLDPKVASGSDAEIEQSMTAAAESSSPQTEPPSASRKTDLIGSGTAELPTSSSRGASAVPESLSISSSRDTGHDSIVMTDGSVSKIPEAQSEVEDQRVLASPGSNFSGESPWVRNGSSLELLQGECNGTLNSSTSGGEDASMSTPSGELSRSEKLQAGIDSAVQAVAGLLNDLVHPSTTTIAEDSLVENAAATESIPPSSSASSDAIESADLLNDTAAAPVVAAPPLNSSLSAGVEESSRLVGATDIDGAVVHDTTGLSGPAGVVVTTPPVNASPPQSSSSPVKSDEAAVTMTSPPAPPRDGAASTTAAPAASTAPATAAASPPAATSDDYFVGASTAAVSSSVQQPSPQSQSAIPASSTTPASLPNSSLSPQAQASSPSSTYASASASSATSSMGAATVATASPASVTASEGTHVPLPAFKAANGTATKKLEACLKSLNFTKFKEKYKTKLDAHFAAKRGDDLKASGKQLKRFDEVMSDKLKSLETSNIILEMYMEKMHNCYKSLMEDLREEHRGVKGRVEKTWKDAAVEIAGMHRQIDEETPAGSVLKGELAALRNGAAVVDAKLAEAAWWATTTVLPTVALFFVAFLVLLRQHRAIQAMQRRLEDLDNRDLPGDSGSKESPFQRMAGKQPSPPPSPPSGSPEISVDDAPPQPEELHASNLFSGRGTESNTTAPAVQPPAAQVLLQPHDEIEIKRRNESDSGERGHALAAATAPRGVLQHADAPCDAPVSNSPEAPAAPEEERKGQQ